MADTFAADLLKGAFGYQPQNVPPPDPVAPPLPVEPEKKTYVTRDSVVRDNPIETTAAVQDLVWGNSTPGAGQQTQSPMGIGQNLNKPSGWGQTGG